MTDLKEIQFYLVYKRKARSKKFPWKRRNTKSTELLAQRKIIKKIARNIINQTQKQC